MVGIYTFESNPQNSTIMKKAKLIVIICLFLSCLLRADNTTKEQVRIIKGVPDTAVCHLTILRGNIESVNLSGESFNVMADSHEFLTFVLIREVKRI